MAPVRKKARGRNHRFGWDIPAFPARWGNGCSVLSSGTGLIAPVTSGIIMTHRLGISIGMPGPHGLTARAGSFVGMNDHAATRRAPRIPRPTFVTIAKRPSWRARDGARGSMISEKKK
jgi:hypothetical protein